MAGNDPEGDPRQRHDGQESVELAGHDARVANGGAQRLLGDDEVEAVIAPVQDLLALHPRRDTRVQVVGDAVEVDDPAQDGGGVLGGVQEPGDEQRLVPAHEPRFGLQVHGHLLPTAGAGAQSASPLDVHRLDVADSGDEVGDVVVTCGVLAPDADVVFGRRLFPVLDFGHFGALPPGEVGKLATRQTGVFAQVAESMAEGFPGLVNGVRHDMSC